MTGTGKNLNKGGMGGWLIIGLLGVALIVGQRMFRHMVYMVIGVGMIVSALLGVVGWLTEDRQRAGGITRLLASAAVGLIGIWILSNPFRFERLLNVVIGLVPIVAGCMWFARGRQTGDKLTMCIAVVAVILGLVLATSRAATTWMVLTAGFGLLFTAIMGFINEKRLI